MISSATILRTPAYLPGAPSNHRFLPVYNSDRPEVHAIVAGMRGVVDEFPNRVLIGEIYLPVPQLMSYYGKDLEGANLPFQLPIAAVPVERGGDRGGDRPV